MLRDNKMQEKFQSLIDELLTSFSLSHYYADDCYYTCPKHPSGCCNDQTRDGECDCGADEHNLKLKVFAEKLKTVFNEYEEINHE